MLLTLCYRDYARSKQCVLKAVKQGCAIGDLMEEDLYNPFCIDGIDPLSVPPASGVSFSLWVWRISFRSWQELFSPAPRLVYDIARIYT